MKTPLAICVCLSLFLLVPLGGCDSTTTSDSDPQGMKIVTTTGMIADLTRQIAGTDYEVVQLLGDGVDPHLYKPTRDDIQKIATAQLVLFNGLLLEGKMGDVLSRANTSGKAYAVTEAIDPKLLFSDEHDGSHPDPHVWMDAALWEKAGERILFRLTERFPQDTAGFQERWQKLQLKIQQLDSLGKKIIKTIPQERRILVTSHDAFRYFGRAYGLRVEAIQGISTESEAGLRRINDLVDLIVDNKLPAVFIESSVPRDSIDALVQGAAARGHTVAIGGELFSDAMGPQGTPEGTYIGMIEHNLKSVAIALGGSIPAEASLSNEQVESLNSPPAEVGT